MKKAESVVISPHLDDAVLSCGKWIEAHPGTAVLTMFAGVPADRRFCAWDKLCGFKEREKIHPMEARRREDVGALGLLGAFPVWMGKLQNVYLDQRYNTIPLAAMLWERLNELRPKTVLAPLGLRHTDHKLCAEACLMVREDFGADWIFYEDFPYNTVPGVLDRRLAQLQKGGHRPYTCNSGQLAAPGRKAEAYALYKSQVKQLDRFFQVSKRLAMNSVEQFWRIP